ncbi:Cna B-type domain-containing protein [Neobittarella massiliensis]|uniref:Cna B-type domain-containing protein n=1 Tax=Neobittarella massiliensis (ex Bilen et al. 2018) TaxID=2041842 RepID=A0A8J6LYD8_9FIRM|nr:Cna B-type domain-containing protein [Neobittarella massiliensis]MBC3515237.1 Cna B-type domain-containing protein [Neobittarella massiliensis]
MKYTKKLLSVLLSVALLCTALPTVLPVRAADRVDLVTQLPTALTPSAAFTAMAVGGSTDEQGEKANLWFDWSLDSVGDTSYIQQTGSAFATKFFEQQTRVPTADDYLAASDDDLPPIGFQFSCILSDNISVESAQLGAFPIQVEGENIGNYAISLSGGSLLVTGSFDKSVYARTSVAGRHSMELNVDPQGDSDPEFSVEPKNGQLQVAVEFKTSGGGSGQPNSNYTLQKSALPRSDTDPHITYTLAAGLKPDAPADATLAGLVFSDPIPQGLTVTGVELDGTALEDVSGYTITDGTLSVTIPAVGSAPVTSAVVTVNTQADLATYQAFLEGQERAFQNTAVLHRADSPKSLAISDPVTSDLKGAFFAKSEGQQVGSNGRRYHWTVTAQTYFTGGQVWLVDRIQHIDTAHMYELSGGSLSYQLNGSSYTAARDSSFSTSYSALTADILQNSGQNAPFYYTCDTDHNGIDDEAVLIIPLTGAQLSGPLTLKYCTQVVEQSEQDYQNKVLKNDATMLWSAVGYGPGPGELPAFSFSLQKETTAHYNLGEKTYSKYDQDTRLLTWQFDVNQCGKEMGDVCITDVLSDHSQRFAALRWQVNGGAAQDVPYWDGTGTAPAAPYYQKATDSGATSLTIHLGNIPADQLYTLSLDTEVVDAAFLATQGSAVDPAIQNTATIYANVGGAPQVSALDAGKKLPNTLLTKKAIKRDGSTEGSQYDYQAHAVNWQVTVNPHHIPLVDGVLTDTLPVGTSFKALLSVRRTTAAGGVSDGDISSLVDGAGTVTFTDGSAVELSHDLATNDSGFSADTATFTLRPSGGNTTADQYTFTFCTSVDQDYRDQAFVSMQQQKLVNNAVLTGSVADIVDGALSPLSASASATQTFKAPPADKSGQYHANTQYGDLGKVDYASWKVVMNADQIDMAGASLVDQLPSWFELDPSSVDIREAAIDADGKATVKPRAAAITEGLTAAYDGFNFAVPTQLARTPLIITFDTLLVDSTSAGNMKNGVSLRWNDGREAATAQVQASGAAAFDVGRYATALSVPYLQIDKTSTNNAGFTADGRPLFALGGAEFTLVPLTYSSSGWAPDPSGLTKTRTTAQTSGTALFLFLQRDTLYQLVETSAPAGYSADTAPSYVVFQTKEPTAAYPAGTTVIDGSEHGASITVENQPQTGGSQQQGSVWLTKQTETGQPLPGAVFTLHDKSGKTVDQQATSGRSGLVHFDHVDPGQYTLDEQCPSGFATAPSYEVTVQYDTAAGYQFTMSGTSGLTGDPDSGYTVINTYTVGDVSLRKTQSESADIPVSGAEFTIYADGQDHPAAYLLEDPAVPGSYRLSSTSMRGAAATAQNAYGDQYWQLQPDGQLMLLTGTYALRETVVPFGFSAPSGDPLCTFTVTDHTKGQPVQLQVQNGLVHVSKTVEKRWDDDGDRDGLRPAAVTVQLLADGTPLGDPVQVTSQNGWTYTWSDLLYAHGGREIVYSVQEIAVPTGYTVHYSAGNLLITNTHQPHQTQRSVTKHWSDDGDQAAARPDTITVQLLADGQAVGEPVQLDAQSGWSYTWPQLPQNSGGKPLRYTAQEIDCPAGYMASYSDDTFTITNTYQPQAPITDRPGDSAHGGTAHTGDSSSTPLFWWLVPVSLLAAIPLFYRRQKRDRS